MEALINEASPKFKFNYNLFKLDPKVNKPISIISFSLKFKVSNLDKLKKLKINASVDISENSFQGLNSLEELELVSNRLESRSFDYVKTLKHLDLCKLKYFFLFTVYI